MTAFESINNLSLIQNGLLHIEFEMNRPTPSMFRVARESHSVLYRSMIEALKGSANLAITGRPSKDRMRQYRIGDEPFKEIHKVPVAGCKQAWRFSQPVVCEPPPEFDYSKGPEPNRDDYLISFYDALAMVQSECFMRHYVMSSEVAITDDEMKRLEWLHEDIRNEYEHFIPKGSSYPVQSLLELTILSLCLSRKVLLDSKNTFPLDETIASRIDVIIDNLRKILSTAAAS
jgi:hypothetical protein